MQKTVRNTRLLSAVIVSLFLCSSAAAQQFVNSGQTLTGLYAGSAQWGFYDTDSRPDLLLTGLNEAGKPVTLVYQNFNGTLTLIDISITGVYFSDAKWGDYDNDGDLDIAVVGLGSADIVIAEIWKNDNGTFVPDDKQSLTGLRYASAAWGDYNNDGLLDLITTGMDRFGESRTILYKNIKGEGVNRFILTEDEQPLQNISKGKAAFGDYDSDGDLDLVLSGIDANGFPNSALYKNNPVGFFTYDSDNSEKIAKLSNGTLLWRDADADGDLDLLQTGLTARWETEIYLYENEPTGRLRGNLLSTVQDVAGPAAWVDLDNDGDLDIAVSGKDKFSTLYANVLERNGNYTQFLNQFTKLRNGAFAAGDFNADGNLDLLVSGVNESNEFKTALFQNTTGGLHYTPTPPAILNPAIVTNDRIILTWDKGSDTQTPDNLLSYNVRIGTQSDKNKFLSGAIPVTTGNTGNRLSLNVYTQLAEGTYVWSVQTVNAQLECSAWSQEEIFRVEQFVSSLQNVTGFQYAASAWGDYDNDGDPDLVVAGTDANGNNRAVLYINENGMLTEDRTVNNELVKFNYGDFAWGDYDNDGDLDLAYTGFYVRQSPTSGLYRNDDGVLTEIEGVFTKVGFASLDWGDYDNDGDLDLAVMGKTEAGPFITHIFKNDYGVLSRDTDQSLIGYANGALRWVDYDNDGDLDLSITGQSANGDDKIRIYKNDPTGTLSEDQAHSDLPSFNASSDLTWADIDDDGDLDMIVTGVYENSAYKTLIFRNEPAGTLSEDTGLSANLLGAEGVSITVGDYDNDGDPDLIVSGFNAGPILKVYENNTTSFDEEVLTIMQNRGVYFSSVFLIDIDGDGDLELTAIGQMKLDEVTYLATSTIYDNVGARSNPNSPPLPVTGLDAKVKGDTVTLSWDAAVDLPIGYPSLRDSLTYQIRVGVTSGGSEIVSGVQPPEIGRFGSTRSRTITGLTSGDYYWSVRAIDNGLAASEWSIDRSFRVDTDPPTVGADSVTVTPDSAGIGTATIFIIVTENFELDLSVLPEVTVKLSGAGDVPVTKLSYSGNTWIGELNILEEYLSGAAAIGVSGITDAIGNVMTPVDTVKLFYIDTDRPQVVTTDPPFLQEDIQKGVKTSITLSATFSEPLNQASVDDDVLKLFRGTEEVTSASNVQLSGDCLSVSALYSNLLPDTEYRAVVVSKIRDRVGNNMEGDFSWQFKTTRIVSAQLGGSVFNTDSSVVLYFSPNAVSADVEIPIVETVPLILPHELTYVNVAYLIGPPEDLVLSKPAQLKIQYDEAELGQSINENKLALYHQPSSNPAVWTKIGGTVNAAANTIIASVNVLGTFALFEDLTAAAGVEGISEISFTPRVFAPRGSGVLPRETSINFVLGRDMNVSILIFNTSGRLVKRLLDNRYLNAGRQSIIWGGRDGDGRILPSGLYTVVIRSGGITKMKTVAISNR